MECRGIDSPKRPGLRAAPRRKRAGPPPPRSGSPPARPRLYGAWIRTTHRPTKPPDVNVPKAYPVVVRRRGGGLPVLVALCRGPREGVRHRRRGVSPGPHRRCSSTSRTPPIVPSDTTYGETRPKRHRDGQLHRRDNRDQCLARLLADSVQLAGHHTDRRHQLQRQPRGERPQCVRVLRGLPARQLQHRWRRTTSAPGSDRLSYWWSGSNWQRRMSALPLNFATPAGCLRAELLPAPQIALARS